MHPLQFSNHTRHDFRMKFLLSQYRKDAGLTQVQVADRLGISQGLYNQLESGRRRMNETYLEGLAKIYRIPPAQLIDDGSRSDPLFRELDSAFRRLSPEERRILVSSAKGILAAREEN